MTTLTHLYRRLHRSYLQVRIRQLLCLADSLLTLTDEASTTRFENALARATALRTRIDELDQLDQRPARA